MASSKGQDMHKRNPYHPILDDLKWVIKHELYLGSIELLDKAATKVWRAVRRSR